LANLRADVGFAHPESFSLVTGVTPPCVGAYVM
jgi:hypothetical protein